MRNDDHASPARDHLPALAVEVGRPIIHQAAALEQVRPRGNGFCVVAHDVRERRFDD